MHDALYTSTLADIPNDQEVIERSGHGELDMSPLTGEMPAGHTDDPEVVGCGNGAVDPSGLPVELRDLLTLHSGRHPSVSDMGLWALLQQADGVLPDDDGAFGAVTCPTVE